MTPTLLPLEGETAAGSAQETAAGADAYGMTAPTSDPKVTAADLRDAATRLTGVVVLDVVDLTVTPARWDATAGQFLTLDGDLLGEDDGTLVVLPGCEPGRVADTIAEHGRPCDAAAAVTRALRQELAR